MPFTPPGHPLLVLVLDHAGVGDALYALTCEVVKGARAATRAARVVVNRRLDVALAAGADGAHLGFDALDVGEARALLGADALVGVSCHSAGEVRAAAQSGADYAHLAPIFDPISKPTERPAIQGSGTSTSCSSAGSRTR